MIGYIGTEKRHAPPPPAAPVPLRVSASSAVPNAAIGKEYHPMPGYNPTVKQRSAQSENATAPQGAAEGNKKDAGKNDGKQKKEEKDNDGRNALIVGLGAAIILMGLISIGDLYKHGEEAANRAAAHGHREAASAVSARVPEQQPENKTTNNYYPEQQETAPKEKNNGYQYGNIMMPPESSYPHPRMMPERFLPPRAVIYTPFGAIVIPWHEKEARHSAPTERHYNHNYQNQTAARRPSFPKRVLHGIKTAVNDTGKGIKRMGSGIEHHMVKGIKHVAYTIRHPLKKGKRHRQKAIADGKWHYFGSSGSLLDRNQKPNLHD